MSIRDINFEWDENKNEANIFKHKIDFRDAVAVWNDPCMQERYDIDNSTDDEDRWQVIGLSKNGVLMVIYTDRVHQKDSDFRIISARKAKSFEIKQYQSRTFVNYGEI